jgi:hypothetical protein
VYVTPDLIFTLSLPSPISARFFVIGFRYFHLVPVFCQFPPGLEHDAERVRGAVDVERGAVRGRVVRFRQLHAGVDGENLYEPLRRVSHP